MEKKPTEKKAKQKINVRVIYDVPDYLKRGEPYTLPFQRLRSPFQFLAAEVQVMARNRVPARGRPSAQTSDPL